MDKTGIKKTFKAHFDHVKTRGRVFARAVKVRAEIAATRRRMRSVFADLGQSVYGKMDNSKTLSSDADLSIFKTRMEGLEAELELREKELRKILKNDVATDAVEVAARDTTAGEEK